MSELENITSLSDLWKSPVWKKISKAYVEGKTCEWCGAKAGDTYEDSKGKTRKLGLSPHHIEKHKWALPLYNQVKNRLFSAWLKQNRENNYQVPRSLSQREGREYLKNMWARDNGTIISVAFEHEKQKILNTYIHLSPENVIILCTKCHYARERGLLICPVCRKNYRKLQFRTCYSCKNIQSSSDKEDTEQCQ